MAKPVTHRLRSRFRVARPESSNGVERHGLRHTRPSKTQGVPPSFEVRLPSPTSKVSGHLFGQTLTVFAATRSIPDRIASLVRRAIPARTTGSLRSSVYIES